MSKRKSRQLDSTQDQNELQSSLKRYRYKSSPSTHEKQIHMKLQRDRKTLQILYETIQNLKREKDVNPRQWTKSMEKRLQNLYATYHESKRRYLESQSLYKYGDKQYANYSKQAQGRKMQMVRGSKLRSILIGFSLNYVHADTPRSFFDVEFQLVPSSSQWNVSNSLLKRYQEFVNGKSAEFYFPLHLTQKIVPKYDEYKAEYYPDEDTPNQLTVEFINENLKIVPKTPIKFAPVLQSLYESYRTKTSHFRDVSDIPIYFILATKDSDKHWTQRLKKMSRAVFHVMAVLLYKRQTYSIGYGYAITEKTSAMYSPDPVFHIKEYAHKYPIIDMGILQWIHLHRIYKYLQGTTDVLPGFSASKFEVPDRRKTRLSSRTEAVNNRLLYTDVLQQQNLKPGSTYIRLTNPEMYFADRNNVGYSTATCTNPFRSQNRSNIDTGKRNCTQFLVDVFFEQITCSSLLFVNNPGFFSSNCRKKNGKEITNRDLDKFIDYYKRNSVQQLKGLLDYLVEEEEELPLLG